MEESEQDMLARIERLTGQINRHKQQQQQHPHPYSTAPYPTPNYPSAQWVASRGGYRGRGSYRGGRGRGHAVHRNRTLVLNNSTNNPDSEHNGATGTATATTPAWITKTDRHLQLINPAIYEKQSQERAKAIEQTRQLRLKQKNEREKYKLSKHIEKLGGSNVARHVAAPIPQNYEIMVQGIRFFVLKDGSKLKRADADSNAGKATPKSATVGGVRFYRSKNGNLYRSGIVKAQRKAGGVKKIDEPCKKFSTTGVCLNGPRCKYMHHDPTKVAICKEFLKGTCNSGDACDLSHDPTPERTPACLHFVKGNCSKENCLYSHVRVSPAAPVCRAFALYGYCEKGASCSDRHVHECPDFSSKGVCNIKGCRLPHKLKASVLRKNARAEDNDEEESSDLSSDGEDEGDSDDVDSDDLEFLGMDDGTEDLDIPTQQDYVQLR